MYEHRRQALLPRRAFVWRMARHIAVAILIVVGSLVAGMIGYAHFEGMNTLDSFLSAAMILGGMGPVSTPQTAGGKTFAGIYALYSGMVFLAAAGIVLSPLIHRLLHKFHWMEEDAVADSSIPERAPKGDSLPGRRGRTSRES
ncbi:MAG: hypothetical protein KBD56_09655 [Candidatus Eisenbacteria bacterium]|nr:hypothetical protein [Candidatus Eisenbacteria bacterium]